ncbi:MAG: hypothetical protein J1E37_01865 [Prevotella sp.]|nr:hypothetical protein [Prevotella sp.]
MKNMKYIIAAACVVLFTACQDEGKWDAPNITAAPYGNPNIVVDGTKLMTISDLKAKYKAETSEQNKYAVIEDDIQIKGYITCNDRTGNMYKEIALQDETAAIIIGINYGGCFGFLPEGQEIVVSLKGLHIGNYRQQATIGMQYLDKSGTNCVGRMPLSIWNDHYNYTDRKLTRKELDRWAGVLPAIGETVERALFADCSTYNGSFIKTTWDLEKDQGKLAILKCVTIHDGGYYDNDTEVYMSGITFVPGESALVVPGFSTSWSFNEMQYDTQQSGAVVLYTSSYADFAANKLPKGRFNVTGVVKRYKDEWEFIIRDFEDIDAE